MLGGALGLLALAVPALAQDGWERVTARMVADAPEARFRQGGADFLSVEGDFNGDGQPDRAFLVRNTALGRFGVQVEMPAARFQRRILEGELAHLPRTALSMVGPGFYGTSCAGGPAGGACEKRNFELGTDAVSLYEFEGAGRYLIWNGARFEEVWVRD